MQRKRLSQRAFTLTAHTHTHGLRISRKKIKEKGEIEGVKIPVKPSATHTLNSQYLFVTSTHYSIYFSFPPTHTCVAEAHLPSPPRNSSPVSSALHLSHHRRRRR
jgi:hypothetical protein